MEQCDILFTSRFTSFRRDVASLYPALASLVRDASVLLFTSRFTTFRRDVTSFHFTFYFLLFTYFGNSLP